MRSYEDKINYAYGIALNHYVANHNHPKRYDIEEIEGIGQYIYKMVAGECSIQASIEFDLTAQCIRLVNAVRDYIKTLRS